MTVKFTNNASTTVGTGINASATSLTVASASSFPSLSGADDYCYLTLQGATNTTREVVKATALSGNTFTIVRAQDNTSAASWVAGDIVELRMTAALLTDVIDAATVEGVKTNYQYTPTAGQTVFSGADNASATMIINQAALVSVYMNGVRLVQGTDYSVSSANNTVTLGIGATTADIIDIEVYGNFVGQSGAAVGITGGSITGTAITATTLGATGTATLNTLVSNNATISGGSLDGVTIGGTTRGAISGNAISGTSFASTGDMTFGDNDKAIFGAGSDLEIYHSGSNSYIVDSGDGSLYIQGSSNILLGSTTQSNLIIADGGAVTARYAGDNKLATSASGISVTGSVTADGLTTNGAAEGDTYFTGGTASSRLLNVFTSTYDGAANAGHNFKIASGQGAFIFGNNTTANLLTVKSGGIDVTGRTTTDNATVGSGTASTYVDLTVNGASTANYGPMIELQSAGTAFGKISSYGRIQGGTSTDMFVTTASTNSFVLGTNNSERMRIDGATGNVGIGTSLPSSVLSVKSDINNNVNNGILFEAADSTNKLLRLYENSVGECYMGFHQADVQTALIRTNGPSYFNGGNVGIGRIDPSQLLEVHKSTGGDQTVAKFSAHNYGDTGKTYIEIGTENGDGSSRIGSFNTSGNKSALVFEVHSSASGSFSEAMRLDDAGNVIVGGTAQADATSVTLNPQGYILAKSSHQPAAFFDRDNSDGEIVTFRKQGTAVGSIGTRSSGLVVGSGDTGLFYDGGGDRIFPESPSGGAARDAAIDLGTSAARFKNLYLSGTVALTTADKASAANMFVSPSTDFLYLEHPANGMIFRNTAGTEAMRIDSSGNVGIGTLPTNVSGYKTLNVGAGTIGSIIKLDGASTGHYHRILNNNGQLFIQADQGNSTGNSAIVFGVDATERMRIDSSGNLLVGTTSNSVYNDASGTGIALNAGEIQIAGTGATLYLNRQGSYGTIAEFRKDGTTGVGSIGSAARGASTGLFLNSEATGSLQVAGVDEYMWDGNQFYPYADNANDLGFISFRWDDIYATNGTIQTSDRNEKQDIAELSDAEQRVAVACKGLLRKFRWKSKVEEKGDDARIHFGIIAQDLQAAFEAEGLDAGRYAMFIHSTWTDEETGEERSRMGVRYSELLAFIIATI